MFGRRCGAIAQQMSRLLAVVSLALAIGTTSAKAEPPDFNSALPDQNHSWHTADVEASIELIRELYTPKRRVTKTMAVIDAIVALTRQIRVPGIEQPEEARLRYWRGLAIATLLHLSSFDDESVFGDAKTALYDLEFALEHEVTEDKKLAARIAGWISYHFMKDTEKAGIHWRQCASWGDEVCQENIVNFGFD